MNPLAIQEMRRTPDMLQRLFVALLLTLAGFAGAGLRAGLNPLRAIAGQRERWILWLPPALGLGIALYFALPEEPARWIAAAVTSGCVLNRRLCHGPTMTSATVLQ